MKKIIFSLIAIFLLAGCNNWKKEILDRYDDGKIETVAYWQKINGKKVYRKLVKYYSNGLIKEIQHYDENGKKHGKFTVWYPNGKKKWIEYYTHGVKNGKYVYWNQNGNKLIEGYYKDGLADGTWKFYDENGNVTKITYKNGQPVN